MGTKSMINKITPDFLSKLPQNRPMIKEADRATKYIVAKCCLKGNLTNTLKLEEFLNQIKTTSTYQHFLFEIEWRCKYKERLLQEIKEEKEFHRGQFINLSAGKIFVETDKGKTGSTKINDFLREVKKEPKLILLGQMGGGKSTTLRKYLKDTISNFDPYNPLSTLPIFIPLIRYYENPNIKSLTVATINSFLDKPVDEKSLNINNNCILLYDGLDEIIDPNLHLQAINQLRDQLRKSSKIIVSCRSGDYQQYFKNYLCYELKELSKEQIIDYLRSNLEKNAEEIFNSEIEPKPHILSMARHPFLLYLITDKINQPPYTIPANKGLLLQDFVENIPKQKKSMRVLSVSNHEKHSFLSLLAFHMIDREGKGEIACSEETRIFVEKIWNGINPATVVQRAEKERLLKSGSIQGNVVFLHPLIRDYFAAYHLHLMNEEKKLLETERILEFRKWDNSISLLIGISNVETANKIVRRIVDIDPIFAVDHLSLIRNVDNELLELLYTRLSKVALREDNPIWDEAALAMSKIPLEKVLVFFKLLHEKQVVRNKENRDTFEDTLADSIAGISYPPKFDDLIEILNYPKMEIVKKAVIDSLVKFYPLQAKTFLDNFKTEDYYVTDHIYEKRIELSPINEGIDICNDLIKDGTLPNNQYTARCLQKLEFDQLADYLPLFTTRGLTPTFLFHCLYNKSRSKTTDFLIKLLHKNNLDSRIRYCAILFLAEVDPQKADKYIFEFLDKTTSDVIFFIRQLCDLGYSSNKRLMKLAIKHSNGRIAILYDTFPKFKSEALFEFATELIKSNNEYELEAAIIALRMAKNPQGIELLMTLLENEENCYRNEITTSIILSSIFELNGGHRILPYANKLLKNGRSCPESCVSLIIHISNEQIDDDEFFNTLIDIAESDRIFYVRQVALSALMQLYSTNDAVINLLHKLLYDPFVQCTVVRLLGEIKDKTIRYQLLELLESNQYNTLELVQALGNIKDGIPALPIFNRYKYLILKKVSWFDSGQIAIFSSCFLSIDPEGSLELLLDFFIQAELKSEMCHLWMIEYTIAEIFAGCSLRIQDKIFHNIVQASRNCNDHKKFNSLIVQVKRAANRRFLRERAENIVVSPI